MGDLIVNFFISDKVDIEFKKILVPIIVAIITTFITAIISVIVSIVVAVVNSNRNKKTTYINTITSNRIIWMQDLKGFINSFIQKTQVNYYSRIYTDMEKRIIYFEELSSIRNKIFLHLNYKGYLDDKIMTVINNIYFRIEMIYEINSIYKIEEVNEKMKYLFKHYNKEIFNQLLELVEINSNNQKEIIKSLEIGGEVSEALQEAIDKQITKFNDKFRNAPRKIAKEIQNLHNELIMFIQIYLKLEWDRVKDESKSKLKSCDEEKYKEVANKMIEGYSLKLYDYSHEKLPDYLR